MKQSIAIGCSFRAWPAVALVLVLTMSVGYAEERPTFALGDGPWTFDTFRTSNAHPRLSGHEGALSSLGSRVSAQR